MKEINRIFKRTLLTLGFILLLYAFAMQVQAASLTVSTSKSKVSPGESFKVTVSLKNGAGKINASVSNGTGSMSEWLDKSSATFTCKAGTSGTVKISASGTVGDYSTEKDVSVSASKSVTITSSSSSSSSKSSNANLSTLGVTPKDYDFSGFSKDKTSYSVTVPNDVDSLKVSYKTADSKAKVKVTGNDNLEVGTNNIKVVVTAEDGTTKTYTIKVTKLATEDSKPGNVIDEDSDLDLYLTSLSVEGLELSPAFDKNVFSYTTTIDMDTNDMSEVKVNAEANDSKATVEITGNTNLVEGENLINIVVKGTDSSEQTVYQITVNKISQASEIASNNIFDKIKNIKREYLIIGGFIFIVVIIIIILIINHIRNKRYYDEMDEDDYYDNNEENENATSNFNERPQDNFIEELYKRRNNGEKLNEQDEETIEDIENENDRIFNKPKKGETVEYNEEIEQEEGLDFLEERREKRKKGKHF